MHPFHLAGKFELETSNANDSEVIGTENIRREKLSPPVNLVCNFLSSMGVYSEGGLSPNTSLSSHSGLFCTPDFVAPGINRSPAQSPTPNSACLKQYFSRSALSRCSLLASLFSFKFRKNSDSWKVFSAAATVAARNRND